MEERMSGSETIRSPEVYVLVIMYVGLSIQFGFNHLFPNSPVRSTQDIRALRPPRNTIYQISMDLVCIVCSCFSAQQTWRIPYLH